jgi:hypothetical protein
MCRCPRPDATRRLVWWRCVGHTEILWFSLYDKAHRPTSEQRNRGEFEAKRDLLKFSAVRIRSSTREFGWNARALGQNGPEKAKQRTSWRAVVNSNSQYIFHGGFELSVQLCRTTKAHRVGRGGRKSPRNLRNLLLASFSAVRFRRSFRNLAAIFA